MSMPITSPFHARSTAREVVEGLGQTGQLTGQNILITGGAAGIGLETARALALTGAHLTLAVRNVAQGEAAAERIRTESGNPHITVSALDLADLASVRRCAAAWGSQALHILINNAGVMACPLARVGPGWESQFATNHLGHFALTTALLPALQAAKTSRVVTLSSMGHKLSGIDFSDIHCQHREYQKWKAYGQAKSANALMSLGLHLRHAGDGITALAVHPGGVATELHRHVPPDELRAMGWAGEDGQLVMARFKTPEQGASTTVWAALAPELHGRGGLYLENCQQGLPAGPEDRFSGYAPHIMDGEAAQKLWAVSMAMLQTG